MPALLDAHGLVKQFGGRRVVDGVDPRCEAGRIHVDGVEIGRDMARTKRSIGVCTRDDTFDGDFTVEQNLTIAASHRGRGSHRLRRRRPGRHPGGVAPALLPLSFVTGCAFGALGLCVTALVPTIDHMNLPVFLLVLPMGLLSSTYFPLEHPVLVALNLANPLSHLAQVFRGFLIGGPVATPLTGVTALAVLMLAVLVPLDLRLLRRRVLGE